ncbi:MAG: 6-phosphofructokinase [Candidatus Izemoplasmatales bacterium]|jgi:6-phosphofructokinase 1
MQRISVLTSGGDAPGMNAVIRAVVRTGIHYGMEVYAVYEGFKGLVEGKIKKMERSDVSQIINRGGTIIGSSRLRDFVKPEVQDIAVKNLRDLSIGGLVTIGGDGTYRGAMDLTSKGIPCIAIPGTIDNDVASTEYTIGFFTALDTAIDAIDKLRDTSFSHQRCTVVEVMGRNCGDLAIFAGIACGAEIVITKDTGFDHAAVLKKVRKANLMGKSHLVIVVAENITDVFKLAKDVEDNTTYEARASVLGYIQRGGTPSAFDRILASKMGAYAVELLRQGLGGKALFANSLTVGHCDIFDALKQKLKSSDLYDYLPKLN